MSNEQPGEPPQNTGNGQPCIHPTVDHEQGDPPEFSGEHSLDSQAFVSRASTVDQVTETPTNRSAARFLTGMKRPT